MLILRGLCGVTSRMRWQLSTRSHLIYISRLTSLDLLQKFLKESAEVIHRWNSKKIFGKKSWRYHIRNSWNSLLRNPGKISETPSGGNSLGFSYPGRHTSFLWRIFLSFPPRFPFRTRKQSVIYLKITPAINPEMFLNTS